MNKISDNMKPHFLVERPGVLSLIEDSGRFGQTHLGLTQGGPADKYSFDLCHKLLADASPKESPKQDNASAIEITAGGLKLLSQCQTIGCVTGADMPVTINGKPVDMWQTFIIHIGDVIEFGFVTKGLRSYFSIQGGFDIKLEFGSCSTVVREKIGGLTGEPLKQGDKLPAASLSDADLLTPTRSFVSNSNASNTNGSKFKGSKSKAIPSFESSIRLRVILGYQSDWFSELELRRFFDSRYEVGKQFDRMGYRLQGAKIKVNKTQMLSEGIALGAIQIPADGLPIVLLNDRQTIGGYPKIGSVLSIDLDKLSQCKQGDVIYFDAITIEQAHNILHLEQHRKNNLKIEAKG